MIPFLRENVARGYRQSERKQSERSRIDQHKIKCTVLSAQLKNLVADR